jgi:hypothetical protein
LCTERDRRGLAFTVFVTDFTRGVLTIRITIITTIIIIIIIIIITIMGCEVLGVVPVLYPSR